MTPRTGPESATPSAKTPATTAAVLSGCALTALMTTVVNSGPGGEAMAEPYASKPYLPLEAEDRLGNGVSAAGGGATGMGAGGGGGGGGAGAGAGAGA